MHLYNKCQEVRFQNVHDMDFFFFLVRLLEELWKAWRSTDAIGRTKEASHSEMFVRVFN